MRRIKEIPEPIKALSYTVKYWEKDHSGKWSQGEKYYLGRKLGDEDAILSTFISHHPEHKIIGVELSNAD